VFAKKKGGRSLKKALQFTAVRLCLSALSILALPGVGGPAVGIPPTSNGGDVLAMDKAQVLAIMERAADWQIANQGQVAHHDLDWTNAALYIGMSELAAISKDPKYERWLLDIGEKYRWQPHYDMYLADDIAVSQMYLDMYRRAGDKRMLDPTQARTEWVIRHPSASSLLYNGKDRSTLERWSWCDALFMAPPVYAQLYSLTRDRSYLKFLDKEYKATYDFLYDKREKLFFRDHNYFDKREANGQKIFWGRGNGWVMGGLVKILKELPKGTRSRKFYEALLVEMSGRVAGLQDPDGYWHASLLDPETYPNPETSGSGFFVYALAYGINSGLLDKAKYLSAVLKGWEALQKAVFPDGKLGWVQPIGSNPRQTTKDMTEVYGVGAFLLAGSEIYRFAE
jgi:unsaturated rhamnogalacturonyl hydrolase